MFLKAKMISNKLFFIMFLPAVFMIFIFGFLLLAFPQVSANGVKEGMKICLDTVIPSLFPFLVVTTVANDVGVFSVFAEKGDKLTRFLFALPGVSLPIIIMSLIGGYPVGAVLIQKAFEKGVITSAQAKRMLMFCVNPGPAFTVSTVGSFVLGSEAVGVVIYFAVTVSSVILGILSRFFYKAENSSAVLCEENFKKNIPETVCNSIADSAQSMLNICIWIVIFSCMGKLVEILPISENVLIIFRMVSEVTNGAITASKYFSVPVVAAVISFGGFCVHFQLMTHIVKLRLKYKYFLAVRLIAAAMSCSITYILLKLFPGYCQVISLGSKPQSAQLNTAFPICACFMIMCGLFLIGDNYILHKKTNEMY